jgi:hypothetical protein
VPVSGPMDPDSAILANELLGNDEHAAVLEVTLLGPTLRFERDSRIAITGALFEVELEGRGLPTPLVADVAAGGRLRFGGRYGGCRAYIAVAGGLCGSGRRRDVPVLRSPASRGSRYPASRRVCGFFLDTATIRGAVRCVLASAGTHIA